MLSLKQTILYLLATLLVVLPILSTTVTAAPTEEAGCLFFTETGGGQGGFSVCNDGQANFRAAFEAWGLQKVGYPISRRYMHDGFVTQAFQKAIMQWRPESSRVALVNIFDDLHNAGYDDRLLQTRQTPKQLPPGWDGDISFGEVVQKRQALLNERLALPATYFSSSDPFTFYGLPTSEVGDMGNHYAIRLQRAVLQEWKEDVPWASRGEVTIANGGDIAKELGFLPAEAVIPEANGSNSRPTPTPAPQPTTPPASGFNPNSSLNIDLEAVVSGLRAPVGVVNAGDGSGGRLFVVENGGFIRVVEGGQLLPQSFLDVSALISNAEEQGLLGMAFEPQRPSEGSASFASRFYINYTNRQGDTVIARYRVSSDKNLADGSSGEILLTIPQPADNHNGGHLLFGPDGYLWIGMGDGGAAGDRFENAQNRNTLLGAMLRIDVRGDSGYTIPSDNPFSGILSARGEIWAMGLRNPWRYSFDRQTGDLWIADVGQAQWEEVNRVSSKEANLNYGWPIMEGKHCYRADSCNRDGFMSPITEYKHTFGCSITGGYVYRGEDYPQLEGGYLFADYCTGIFWAIDASSQNAVEPTIILRSGTQITSFGEDERGELYVTAFDGRLYRIVAR
jgi:glucose/arabinose dehydrogenase